MKRIMLMALLLMQWGCGQDKDGSLFKGHYEEASASKMRPFIDQQVVVPEFSPSAGVIVSLDLMRYYHREDLIQASLESGIDKAWIMVPNDFSGNLEDSAEFSDLRDLLGDQLNKVELLPQQTEGRISVWARDWAPLSAVTEDGSLHLLDFNYYPSQIADDGTPSTLANHLDLQRISIPVYNEGGNFMSNQMGHCVMTDRITQANDGIFVPRDRVLSNSDIEGYLADFAGCRRVTIFPRMPYEATGHIDIWAKFISDEVVFVSEVSDDLLNLYHPDSHEFSQTSEIKDYLDQRAQDFENFEYQVVRIPMPLPEFRNRYTVIRSFTNTLFLNDRAIMPWYRQYYDGSPYVDDQFLAELHDQAKSLYETYGYNTSLIDSDKLIFFKGAVHCVTMQVARAF